MIIKPAGWYLLMTLAGALTAIHTAVKSNCVLCAIGIAHVRYNHRLQNNVGGCSTNRLTDSTGYVVWHFGQIRWNS